MAISIVFEGIAKRFGTTEALRNLDLTVEPGERLVLLGPSGCGKTTALRIVAGLETPDAGTVRLGDRLVNDPRPRVAIAGRKVGMVFQSLALWPHMTVSANLRFVMPAADPDRVRELLDMIGLADRAGAYPHELSGGQQQRVALARALAGQPQVLLLDEPMANLDADLKRDLLTAIRGIQEKLDITLIYVTHDQAEATALGHKLAVLRDGALLQVGTPDDVYNHPTHEFVARFIGRNNLLQGAVTDGSFKCAVGVFAAQPGPQREQATAVVPAEALRLKPDPDGPGTVSGIAFRDGRYDIDVAAAGVDLVATSLEPAEVGVKVSLDVTRPVYVLPG